MEEVKTPNKYCDRKTGQIVHASEYKNGQFVRVDYGGRVTIEYPRDFEKQFRRIEEKPV